MDLVVEKTWLEKGAIDFVVVVDEEEGEMIRGMRQMAVEFPHYFKKVIVIRNTIYN